MIRDDRFMGSGGALGFRKFPGGGRLIFCKWTPNRESIAHRQAHWVSTPLKETLNPCFSISANENDPLNPGSGRAGIFDGG
jgi:hypothetical protein